LSIRLRALRCKDWVTGLYRYVRNPIYVALVAVILGQAVLFGDWRLFLYGALVFVAFHIFVLAYTERPRPT
jgi:protein-S-isoprenylcysteine O-methyltransferase Ste14